MVLYRRKPKKATDKKEKAVRGKREVNHTSNLDRVFQFYIRLRDSMPNGMCRCISCGSIKPFSQIQAGHYYSRRHMATRWNEDNVHGECSGCNCFDGDHLIDYRRNLERKIGIARLQYLDFAHKTQRQWSDFEIIALIRHYGRLVMQISVTKGIPVASDVVRIIKSYERKYGKSI